MKSVYYPENQYKSLESIGKLEDLNCHVDPFEKKPKKKKIERFWGDVMACATWACIAELPQTIAKVGKEVKKSEI